MMMLLSTIARPSTANDGVALEYHAITWPLTKYTILIAASVAEKHLARWRLLADIDITHQCGVCRTYSEHYKSLEDAAGKVTTQKLHLWLSHLVVFLKRRHELHGKSVTLIFSVSYLYMGQKLATKQTDSSGNYFIGILKYFKDLILTLN